MDAGAAGFDGAGDLAQPRGGGPAAVEADKCVVWAERECRPVAELLEREPGGEQVRRLAHLERALGRRPLIRAGADEVEATLGQLDRRARCLKGGGDRPGHGVELAE